MERLDDEVLQIDSRIVRVQVRAERDVNVTAAAIGQFGARVAGQGKGDERARTIDAAL